MSALSDSINPYILLCELCKLLNGKNDPVTIDTWLKKYPFSLETDLGGSLGYGLTMLHLIVGTNNYLILYYLLTSPSLNINIYTKEVYRQSNGGETPLHYAVEKHRKVYVERLLAFGADRRFNGGHKVKSPIQLANNSDYRDRIIANVLNNYYPSENEKIITQKVAKLSVECCFEQACVKRIDNELVDVKFGGFESTWDEVFPGILDGVRTGDLDRLKTMEELENVKKYWFCERESIMLLYLALESIEYSNQHLLGYLCRQIFKLYTDFTDDDFDDDNYNMNASSVGYSSVSEYISTILDVLINLNNTLALELIKKLILIGLEPSCIFKCYVKWIDDMNYRYEHDKIVLKEVAKDFDTSSILCAVKLLFHKQIYLDEDNNCILIQTLIGEGLLFGL